MRKRMPIKIDDVRVELVGANPFLTRMWATLFRDAPATKRFSW